ncbi:MAG: penicillin-binding protein 2 [Acidimicrobiales bacterium]
MSGVRVITRSARASSAFRLGILGVVVLSLFAAMLARLWYLQVLAGPEYRQAAQSNGVRFIYSEAPRGRIVDRQGRELVGNAVVSAVLANKTEMQRRPDVLTRLAVVLGRPESELAERLADQRFSPFKPVPVADEVPKETLVYLREHRADFPGVEGVQRTRRSYANGALAAHVVGYVAEINDRELASRRSKGYRSGDSIGKSGLELAYEEDLRGQPQIEKLEVDSEGRVLRTLGVQRAVPGHDVQLTIDLDVQRVAEDSLAQGIKAAQSSYDREQAKRFLATAGSVVVTDPRDGSVLAMASLPTYDPTEFVDGISRSRFAVLSDPANHYPLNNRAIQGLYAPGSTFKLATAMAGLAKGVIAPRDTVDDTGSISIGNPPRVFRNALGKSHGRVDVTQAIAVSSDVFFYRLGQRFWEGRGYGRTSIQETARGLGMGQPTGVELPFEAGGRVPDPESRKRLNQANPKAFPTAGWYTGDNVNLAIGQGEMAVTPLQLANAYGTFANGGTVYATRLGRAILGLDGKELRRIAPRVLHKIDLPASTRSPMLAGFQGAVSDPLGTAYQAFSGFPLAQYRVAGKTGTAQAPPKQDTALFVGFAPAENPQFVVSVVMEEAGFGSSAAAPVARRIFEGLFGLTPAPTVERAEAVD